MTPIGIGLGRWDECLDIVKITIQDGYREPIAFYLIGGGKNPPFPGWRGMLGLILSRIFGIRAHILGELGNLPTKSWRIWNFIIMPRPFI